MINIFDVFLVQPIFNALIFIYNFLPWADIGLAAIILTVIIRVILFPFFQKSTRQQMLMSRLQPEISKIQKEHKDDKQKLAKAQMDLYKKHNVNPFGGCFLTIIQLPILLAVYRVFYNGFGTDKISHLYSFVAQPEIVNTLFLGLIDLSKPNIILAIITAILQFISSKMLIAPTLKTPKDNKNETGFQKIASSMQKNITYIAPIITLIILISLPAILAIYWSATTVFSIAQQRIVQKKLKEIEL